MAVYQTLKLTETSVDKLANTSKVKVVWKSQQTGQSHNDNKRTAKYWITANGKKTAYTVDYTLPANTTETILSKTFTIQHEDDGTGSVKVETWMDTDIYAGEVEMSKKLTLTPIARASTIGAADAFIESTAIVIVNRKSESYSHSVAFSFGEISGFLNEDGSVSETESIHEAVNIPFAVPDSFYAQIPDKPSGVCTLTCKTYYEGQQIGQDQTANFTATAKPELCKPEVTGTVVDINQATLSVTENPDVLIKHVSTALCSLYAEARNGATIVSKTINGTPVDKILEIPEVTTGEYILSATDSRGYTTNLPVVKAWIPYIKRTVNAQIVRTDPTSGGATLTVSGKWYPGSLGKEKNKLRVFYELYGSDPVEVPVTASGEDYSGSIKIEGLSYASSFYIPVSAEDKLGTETQTVTVKPGIPVFDWGKNDFAFNVPVYYLDKLLEDWFLNKAGDTMRGVLAMGGNQIKGLGEPALPADAVTKSYADRRIRMELVWEDTNPIGFATKTIDCDLSEAQAVAIEYAFSVDSERRKTAFGIMNSNITLDVISKSFFLGSRIAFPRESGVYFGAAEYNGTGSSVDPDNYMIPVRIFSMSGITGLPQVNQTKAICGMFTCGMAVAGQ